MGKIKNVVVVNDFGYTQGGASKIAIDTANILYDMGYKVWFFTGDVNNTTKVCIKDGIIVMNTGQGEALKDVNRLRGIGNGIYNGKAKRELRDLLRNLESNETIVHIHGWTKCLSSSVFSACFKEKFSVVLTLHDYFSACPNGGFFNYKENKICYLCPMSVKCLMTDCDSRSYGFKIYRVIRQFVQNNVVGLNKKVRNVIYISDLQWSVLEKNFKNLKNKRKILNPVNHMVDVKNKKKNKDGYYLYVGRLSREKGIEIFCKAFSDLNLPAVVVGDGPLFQELSKKYDNIKFEGWKSHKEALKYMREAKALVFPSLWYEGAPLVPVEAENNGLACIVSDKSSAKEFIRNKEYIYNGNSIDSLKGVVERFEVCYNSVEVPPKTLRDDYGKELTDFYEKSVGVIS